MDDYLTLLILAYFREVGANYSLIDLHNRLGLSMRMLNFKLDSIFEQGLLEYGKSNLMRLSREGEFVLRQSKLEKYSFECDMSITLNLNEKWEIDRIYPIRDFSKNKWRGSED